MSRFIDDRKNSSSSTIAINGGLGNGLSGAHAKPFRRLDAVAPASDALKLVQGCDGGKGQAAKPWFTSPGKVGPYLFDRLLLGLCA
jgi:hypothetical protein